MNDQDLLRKVSLLLKKAEGTDNEHEADAFFEKAHSMMVEYAIDEARVRAEQRRIDGVRVEEPVVEDYMFSSYGHHSQAKASLLDAVARNHSVRVLMYSNRKDSNHRREGNRGLKESQWTRLVGYKSDIEATKMLYVSLLIQSQRFASEDWRRTYGEAKYSNEGIGKFSWLSAHMDGFAGRIGDRFHEITLIIYKSTAGSEALIVDKDANILEWMYEHGLAVRPKSYCWATGFPPGYKAKSNSVSFYCIKTKGHEDDHVFNYKPSRGSSYVSVGRRESYEGRRAGRVAADRADIGQTRVGASSTRLIRS